MTMLDDLVIVDFRKAVSRHGSERARLCVCDQGSDEWHRARLGIPTASCASALVTPTGKARTGEARSSYAYELAFEKVYGRDLEAYENDHMRDGKAQEAEARDLYATHMGYTVQQVGFVYGTDALAWGASPDGLIDGKDGLGGVEIKRRQRSAMSKILSADKWELSPAEYAQDQFNMFVTGGTWWDHVLYFPAMRPICLIQRIRADLALQERFAEVLPGFIEEVAAAERRLRELSNNKGETK